jgi:tripartite motif-containing protein 71
VHSSTTQRQTISNMLLRAVMCSLVFAIVWSLCTLTHKPTSAAAASVLPGGEPENPGSITKSDSLSAPLGAELLTDTPSAETSPEVESVGSSQQPTRSDSAQAAQLRKESATGYEGLDRTEAAALATEAFPGLVAQEAGATALPAGASILGYLSPTIAAVALPEHQHGVIESAQPMAVEASPNHNVPLDLSLTSTGSTYESSRPSVGVLIPRRLEEGAQLPERGVSLTPVDQEGTPPQGTEGSVDGASVLYPNVQTDTDVAIRPTPEGVEVNTILRSEKSPRTLQFRIALPSDATLSQTDGGEAKIMQNGNTVAVVRPPSARDAEGTTVPVTMSAVGNLLTLNVSMGDAADYRWPIAVDPELVSVTDSTINEHSNWLVAGSGPKHFKYAWWSSTLEQYNYGGEIVPGENTYAQYLTQGESKIYKVEAETAGQVLKGRAKLALANSGGVVETQTTIAEKASWGATKTTLCPPAGCASTSGSAGNLASFKLEAVEPITETYSLDASLWNTHVYIAQEKAPAITFNEETTLPNGRANAMHGCHCTGGSEPWLGPYSNTGFEAKAHDPGIGVSWAQLVVGAYKKIVPIFGAGRCKGVQCEENYSLLTTYNPEMPDGEIGAELDATNLAGNWLLNGEEIGLLGRGTGFLKIDATKPRNLQISGWPASREISAAPHTLTLEATDGKSPTNSSGVKSIAVAIDGGPQSQVPVTPCTLGPCTVSGKWTLHAEGLTEGVHRLIETATDNASNVASQEFTFDVRHGTPVPVGPGAVDPTTGELKLSAVDASIAGVGAVTRVYQSRNLTAGVGGPLGPQWALGLAGGEGLTVLPDGSVVLSGSKGGHTTFLRTEKEGHVEFESPLGDSNLKLEPKPQEVGKEITEYALVNTSTGSTTHFTQPTGTTNTAPLYANQFGPEATQLNHPLSDAVDSGGNVWVTDFYNNRIEKFSPTGALLSAYGSEGEGAGQFHNPWGIAVNQNTGHVYVTDQSNFRLEEFTASGSFVKAIGWGVSDGKPEPEVCTTSCKAGLAGTGNAQFSWLAGLTLDSSGSLWIADYGNNRVQELSAAGGFLQKFGTEGSGNGQFKGPLNIAFTSGKVYVTDYGNNRVQKFSTAGVYESKFGESGAENGKFSGPYGIATEPASGNLLVADSGNTRVQLFNASGTFLAKFGSSGTGAQQFTAPTGIAVSPSGIYIVDANSNRVEQWAHAAWLPTLAEGALPSEHISYSYEAVQGEEGTVIEPVEALAPPPAGVSCGTKPSELKKGCQALTFSYASTTTASGENRGQWGEYKGRLNKIVFHGYNPTTKGMEEPAVAQYEWDKQGRLRTEWDPRVEHSSDCGGTCSAPKTTYGYDAEQHLAGLTPPGQSSWAFLYGTISGDANKGRLVKATQAPAGSVWNGQPPTNEEAPKITGTAQVGSPLTASTGKWGNGPIGYSFEWQRCNSAGAECSSIEGVTNPRYTPTFEDAGHTLVARVAASNGGGTTYVSTSASGGVKAFTEYSLATGSKPDGIAVGSDKNLWVANRETSKLAKVTTSGAVTEYALPAGSYPTALTNGPDENIWFTNGATSKVGKLTTGGTRTEYALPAKSWPVSITVGSDHNVWVAERESFKIAKVTTAGTITQYPLSLSEGAVEPDSITAGPDGNLWFTTQRTAKVGKITTAGAITEYPLPGGSGTVGRSITSGPDGALWFVRENGKVARMTTGGSITAEYSLPAEYKPTTISTGPDGNLWVTSDTSPKLVRITPSGAVSECLTGGSLTLGAVAGPDGKLWVAENSTDRIGKLVLESAPPENYAPSPGYTVEYHVSPSGGTPGLPDLSKEATEKWRQTADRPTEGLAVIPPDEPQSWPATSYRRATINYLDELGRTVNVATPAGGVSTTEYNELNEVTRTLTADARASALNEGSRSGEVSEKLDTKTQYNLAKTEIEKVTGPQHLVKLPTGAEVQARSVTRDYYDEGAPGGKIYGLLTRTTVGAEYEGKEADVSTTLSSYSGQEGLGWTLRRPTSTTVDPASADLVTKTIYDKNTGNVLETRNPGGNTETVYPPAFSTTIGALGSGNGQFKEPCGVTIDAGGNLWVVDGENGRVEKFSPAGTFLAAYGSKGSGNLQFQRPFGIAINPSSGNVYVGDYGNNRVEELSSSGAYVTSFGTTGSGALLEPMGVTIDASGNVWVADRGHNRVVEFSAEGNYVRAIGTAGSGNGQFSAPMGLAISEGSLFAVDSGNGRVEQFSLTGVYLGQFGSKGAGAGQLKEPFGIASNPSTGNLYVADLGNNRVDEFSPAGRFLTSWETWGPAHPLSNPIALAVGGGGTLYVSDVSAGKLSAWTPPEAGAAHLNFTSNIGSPGSGNGQFSTPVDIAFDGEGNTWTSDLGNNRIEKFSSKGSWIASYGSFGSGNEQFNAPGGIDVNQSTGNVYIGDTNNARIVERSSSGAFIRTFGTEGSGKLTRPGSLKIDSAGNVWVPDMSANKIFEFSSAGTFIAVYGKTGSGAGEVAFKQPVALAIVGENIYVADAANHRVLEMTNKGAFVREFAKEGHGSGELYDPEGIAADGAGNLYVADAVGDQVEEFNSSGTYMATFSSAGSGEGQLKGPLGDAIDAAGNLYIADSENNRLEKWSYNNPKVRYTKNVYYSSAGNSEYPQCGEQPQWANLLCQTEPVAQPSDAPPALPVTSLTYNLWQQIEVKTEKLGSTTRTTKETYDAAARPLTSEETSTAGEAMPTTSNEYSSAIGALVRQSNPAASITSTFNTRLMLTKYVDADGNESKYKYDEDNRPVEVSDGKGTQILARDPYTGELTELFDSAVGKFTATYDPEGKPLTQGYPNGMTASYKANSVGEETQLEYVKTTHCSSNCTLFSETAVPSIHGQMVSETNTLATKNLTYDSLQRLSKTQETPAGKGCTTRLYSYGEESERTSLTTREPGVEGKCAEEGGITERHIYDQAGRIIDPGVTYDLFGNATSLPASDAGGHEMTASFYIDNQVKMQTQNGETLNFGYDAAGRTRETVSSGKTSGTSITHYSGPGEARTWIGEGGELWTRNIPGIDGNVDAIQTSAGAPVLQIHDLLGNTVGTAALSETETKLLSTYESTDFGVPQPGTTPPRYAWLGATGITTEPSFSSGASTQNGAAYVPQIARELQTMPVVPPGAFPNGQVSEGTYKGEIAGWYVKISEQEAAATLAEWTAKQEALRREAEEAAALLAEEELDPHEWAMLAPFQAENFAKDLRKKAGNAEFAAMFFKLLPKLGEELAGSAEGLAHLYEGYAHNLELCAESADRCWVVAGFVNVALWSFTTTVTVELCFPYMAGYDLCQPSNYVRRRNERGKGH